MIQFTWLLFLFYEIDFKGAKNLSIISYNNDVKTATSLLTWLLFYIGLLLDPKDEVYDNKLKQLSS